MDDQRSSRCGIVIRARCWKTADDLTQALAQELAKAATNTAVRLPGIMLAGGTTPLAAYGMLTTRPPTPLNDGLHLLFSDDRHVPPDQPQSNYGQILPMLRAWGLPDERILRVQGEAPLAQATATYGEHLDQFLAQGGQIELGLLGLGADGHTASLFNHQHIVEGQTGWTLAVQRPDGLNGVSVTPRLLREVKRIIFVVNGAGKKAMATRLAKEPQTLTAGQAVAGHRAVELWTDLAAWPFD